MHGQFVWYELTTTDVDAARKFYPPIAGWGTQQFDKDYTMWTNGGVPFAGIFRLGPEQRQQGIPPNWMPYVEAGNVDETARQATSLGGKVVVGPQDIPGTGRFAVLQDPQGATFGIYKSNGPSQSWDGTAVLGRFSWHELMTTDYPKAFDFYRRLFGWEKTGPEMDMGGGSMYLMYGKGKMYGGMFNRPPEMAGMRPFWLCYIHVKDVNKAVDTATKSGAKLQRGPMDVPGGAIAILGDPQGAAFAVHHATAPVAAPKPASKKSSKAASRPKAKATKSRPKRKVAAKRKSATKKRSAAKKSSRRAATKSKRRRR
jgi:predicted enzyme related to lactoylglutathione lyase